MTHARDRVRALLRERPHGCTARQVAAKLDAPIATVRYALKTMPDAYIDRWLDNGGNLEAVWCVVTVPPNCPRPPKKRLPSNRRSS